MAVTANTTREATLCLHIKPIVEDSACQILPRNSGCQRRRLPLSGPLRACGAAALAVAAISKWERLAQNSEGRAILKQPGYSKALPWTSLLRKQSLHVRRGLVEIRGLRRMERWT